jgi:hypothetical protein
MTIDPSGPLEFSELVTSWAGRCWRFGWLAFWLAGLSILGIKGSGFQSFTLDAATGRDHPAELARREHAVHPV